MKGKGSETAVARSRSTPFHREALGAQPRPSTGKALLAVSSGDERRQRRRQQQVASMPAVFVEGVPRPPWIACKLEGARPLPEPSLATINPADAAIRVVVRVRPG